MRWWQYALVWPVLRIRIRRSLAWRLAVSHLLTVFLTLIAFFLVIWAAAVLITVVRDPAGREPAQDAKAVTRVFSEEAAARGAEEASPDVMIAAFQAMVRRDIRLDEESGLSLEFSTNRRLEHVRSISVVTDGRILLSSNRDLIGQPVSVVSAYAAEVVAYASGGSTNLQRNSILRPSGSSEAVGAYPVERPPYQGTGAVILIDKSALSNPRGFGLLWLALRDLVLIIGLNALLVSLPAMAVAALIGIPRARDIVRPLKELAGTANALAPGDLGRRVRVHGEDEVAALAQSFNTMADRLEAALALEAAERARVEERTRELEALLAISHAAASTLELGPLAAKLLDALETIIDYDGASLMTLDGDVLTVLDARAAAGRDVAALEVGLQISIERASILWQRLERHGSVLIGDVRDDSEMAQGYRVAVGPALETPPFEHVRAWLGVTLTVKDRPVGLLSLSRVRPDSFKENHLRLALAVAGLAALAIENAQLYGRAHELAAMEERQRLARELHDSVSQALYGIGLGAHTALSHMERDPARARAPVEYVLKLAQAGMAEMRALIFELRPESLASEGLVVAITKQADSLRARYDLKVETELCEEPDAPLTVKEAIYRIAQEALHNTVKHARANLVHIRMACNEESVVLEITDDGVGFDPEADYPGHLGQRSMRERAARLGGRLEVHSTTGKGTRVRAWIPLATGVGV